MTDIDGGRLLQDLGTLAAIGAVEGGGVDRLAWSPPDTDGRRWFADRIRQAGLASRVDEAGNVFGHVGGSAGPWLLTGSHLDTVPNGGRLDGAYGAVAGLEVLRTLYETGDPVAPSVEVVGFADEEGVRFQAGLIGSLALAGELDLQRLRTGRDWQGVPIPEVLATAGVRLDDMLRSHQHLRSVTAFLELHVEQGPRMESARQALAVVSGIVGVHRERARVMGSQNHAGTTPFDQRHDAGRAAARAVATLRETVQSVDAEAVGNVGVIAFHPGAVNVVPGRADFTLEVRHLDRRVVDRVVDEFHRRLRAICSEEGCRFETELLSWVPPAPMDPDIMDALDRVLGELGHPPSRISSGAGHDAAVLARHVPTGMLFVPSREGVSHAPTEDTLAEHLILGARALLAGVRTVLAGAVEGAP